MEHTLEIDVDMARRSIVDYLREVQSRNGNKGLLLGLSGGIDSSVLAALAVAAVGSSSVHAAYLYDRDSEETVRSNAMLIARHLGLQLSVSDISDEMRNHKIYKPLIMRVLVLSGTLNRAIQRSYTLICGETPFKSTLRVGSGEALQPWYKRFLFNMSERHVDRSYCERHAYRRILLEREAGEKHLTLIGAANRSEIEVGWFVKDGIDDLRIQPLAGLFKTQVRQMAETLELPGEVCRQKPSPDMTKGISDEFGFGHSYEVVDIVIDCLDRGLSDAEIIAKGIDKGELDEIRELRRLSSWKRLSAHEPPPVDGKFGSPIRKCPK
jgi:NAD+ synthase